MLPILTYHSLDNGGSPVSVAPSVFASQMESIARAGVRGISLAEAVRHFERMQTWPDKSVVITFDDGYANVFDNGLPILERLGFSATIFLITSYMGGLNTWWPKFESLENQPVLTWEQAAELSRRGIELGSHTHNHPDLRSCSEQAIEREIRTANDLIESNACVKAETFCYPYGHFNSAVRSVVARHFKGACTTALGLAGADDLHALARVDMVYFNTRPNIGPLARGGNSAYLALRRFGRNVRSIFGGVNGANVPASDAPGA